MENWRTIEGTNGNYSISDLGNVRRNEHYTEVTPGNFSHYKERLLKPILEDKEFLIQLIMKTFSKEDLQQIVDSYKVAGEK